MPVEVSVIVPCYNEEKTIGLLLESLLKQTYSLDQLEVVIADGMSEDGTRREINTFQQADPRLTIRIIDNPKRTIPAALNTAIAAARGNYIVRLDAHSIPNEDYVARSVAGLEEGKGSNVGGVWEIIPGEDTWMAGAIAAAAAHPLGVGDAKYRYTDTAGEVDTVPFGAFSAALVEEIGGFNEQLLANEDYEFNTRIRQAGQKIWLDPDIRAKYFARATLISLAKQYSRYGFWKVRMLRRYPETIRWRQALPPVFVAGLIAGGLLSIWFPPVRWLFTAAVVSYALTLFAVGIQIAVGSRRISALIGVPLAICTMHLSWGGAFLWSLLHK